MPDGVEARREFYEEMKEHPMVESADFTRDGYRTVVLELVDDPEETP